MHPVEAQGYDMTRVKLEEVLAMDQSEESAPRSEMESAVLSQGIRLIFLTIKETRNLQS